MLLNRWLAPGTCAAIVAISLSGCRPDPSSAQGTSNSSAVIDNREVLSGGMDTPLPPEELPSLMNRAQVGDDRAAENLGTHFANLGDRIQERRWHTLAASRGHCNSMSVLREIAYEERDRMAYDQWNSRIRARQCMVEGVPREVDGANTAIPMWVDQPELIWNGH